MNYKQCKDYIRSDYYRITEVRCNSILKLFFLSFLDVGFRYLFWFRLATCSNFAISLFARFFYWYLGQRHHIDIPRKTKIGYGFKIMHGGPCVINESAEIGNNVNMGQFSTIGSLHYNAAKIGDMVYIGPSVCIVEDIMIGNGVTIGAGSVVVKDAPDGVTIAGNPAKVISHKEPARFIWRKWNTDWNKCRKSE